MSRRALSWVPSWGVWPDIAVSGRLADKKQTFIFSSKPWSRKAVEALAENAGETEPYHLVLAVPGQNVRWCVALPRFVSVICSDGPVRRGLWGNVFFEWEEGTVTVPEKILGLVGQQEACSAADREAWKADLCRQYDHRHFLSTGQVGAALDPSPVTVPRRLPETLLATPPPSDEEDDEDGANSVYSYSYSDGGFPPARDIFPPSPPPSDGEGDFGNGYDTSDSGISLGDEDDDEVEPEGVHHGAGPLPWPSELCGRPIRTKQEGPSVWGLYLANLAELGAWMEGGRGKRKREERDDGDRAAVRVKQDDGGL